MAYEVKTPLRKVGLTLLSILQRVLAAPVRAERGARRRRESRAGKIERRSENFNTGRVVSVRLYHKHGGKVDPAPGIFAGRWCQPHATYGSLDVIFLQISTDSGTLQLR